MTTETYGSYQLIKRLAMGGMAQIYLARRRGTEGFEKLLVVKRILPHLAEDVEFVRMFLDEARIAAKLDHPNIVQIFDLGAQDDSYFIAMEYIHGEDLRRVWKRAERSGQAIPVPLVCRILIEACAGLDYAHKRADPSGRPLGIVHRDISPQNILLTFEGRVKVVDFGIAKAADQSTVTHSGVLKGKYSYMSPEQAAGKKVDCRADIFALGVVLYELLTCIRLFKYSSDMATLQAVAECKVAPPSQVNPRVPATLDSIVMKALAKEPGARYSEAAQLQLALEDWLVAHQQASSTAHVAAFMQDLYAARLAEEARLGDVLIDGAEALPPPSSKSAETQVARHRPPPVDSDNAETQPLEAVDLQALVRHPRSSARRSTPGVSRGTSERGAQGSRRNQDGRRPAELGPEPRSTSSRAAVRPSPGKPQPLPPPRKSNGLVVGLISGGLLLVGLALGSWWMKPRLSPPLATVPPVTEPEQVEPLVLEPLPEPPREEERTSLVRFVVKPEGVGATVSCDGNPLGDTSFGDKELAIGSHDCKFSHPELGTRSFRVDVKPNAHNTVVVEF